MGYICTNLFVIMEGMRHDGIYFETEKQYEDYLVMKEYNKWWNEASFLYERKLKNGTYKRGEVKESSPERAFGQGGVRKVQVERPGHLIVDFSFVDL